MPIEPPDHIDAKFPHTDTTKAGHTDAITYPHVDTPAVHTDAAKVHTDAPAHHFDVITKPPAA